MSSNTPPPSSFENTFELKEETPLQKFFRRLKQEPLVPLGCGATCYALYRAYRSMRVGDSNELNRMFRARIYAQAFTIVAIVAGGWYYRAERQQRREFEQMLDARKNQEKRDAWLRELEIRDQEDRDWRERHAAIQSAAKEAGQKKKDASKQQGSATAAAESKEDLGSGRVGGSAVSEPVEDSEEKKGNGGIVDAVKGLVSGKK